MGRVSASEPTSWNSIATFHFRFLTYWKLGADDLIKLNASPRFSIEVYTLGETTVDKGVQK